MARGRGRALAVTAVALVVIGLLGMIAVTVMMAGYRRALVASPAAYGSNGERIYFTGRGHAGRIRIDWEGFAGPGGMMGARSYSGPATFGCAECHGADGRGRTYRMMDWVQIPDIRYGALTTARSQDETGEPALTDYDIAQAIREGIEPGGGDLDAFMPRWAMDGVDMKDTIDYLKELDKR